MNEAKAYLEQLSDLNIEVNQLEEKLKELQCQKYEFGTDGVTGSSKTIPYAKHNIIVSGYGLSKRVQREIDKLGQTYADKLERLYTERREAEALLDGIEDSKARTIIRYYYIDGMTWQQVADKLNKPSGDNTEGSVKMYCKRILENC